MSRHKLGTFTVTAAVAVALAGCTGTSTEGNGDGAAEGSGGDRSIKWLIEEPEDATALRALEDHVADFEAESGIDVEVDTLPLENMRTVLQAQLRSGEGPDVFNWGSGPSFGGALAENGLVLDLTEAYEEHDWQVYESAKERVTVDGKVYGIPGELETIGLFYNKDVFDDLGLEAPQSLEELDAAAKAILDSGKIPFAFGDKEGWEGGHLLSMTLSSAVGSEGMEAFIQGEEPWDSPEVVSALQVWKDFSDAGYLPESPAAVDYDTSAAMFYSAEAAMIPTGSWLVGEIDDAVGAKFETGYIPFPAPDGPGIFTGGLGSGPYVSATTSDEESAIEFVDFLASQEHGQWTVENLHTIPPMEIDTEDLDVSPLFAQVLEDTAGGDDLGYNIDVLVGDQLNEAMWDGVQAVLTGQQTPEDVAAAMEAAAQE